MAFLGLDIGTSATKALLLSSRGKILATTESPHELLTPQPGWTEQHPADWWKAVISATRTVMKKAGMKGDAIQAIALSGQMHGSVFLDKDGKVIRPAILWNDQRTASQCTQIETLAGGRTALLQMVSNPALTGFTAPKILWLKQNEPKNYSRVKQILLPKDYIRFELTGRYASEVSDASGTLLLDVKNRCWHDGLIRKLNIDPGLLPPVFESQEVSGRVTARAAKLLGVCEGIPVAGGGGDQAMGAVGCGVVAGGLISAAMGTSGVIFAASDKPQTDPLGRVHTMCHAVPRMWCVFGCMLSAGGSLQWLRNMLFAEEMKRLRDAGELYPKMIAEAAGAPAGAENLFFLPYLTGERCPHPDANATGCFVGLTPRHGRGHVIRSVLEGITFGMREQIMIFRNMKIPIREIRSIGGGARSSFWRQLQADMYQAPVATIRVSEGAALGAAIIAAVAVGAYPSVPAACKELIRTGDVCTPAKKAAAFYERQYAKYAGLYPALKDQFPAVKAP